MTGYFEMKNAYYPYPTINQDLNIFAYYVTEIMQNLDISKKFPLVIWKL